MNVYLIYALIVLFYLLQGYFYFMILTIILGWLPSFREGKIYPWMEKVTDVYLGRFKGILVAGQVDFTPIVGFIIYNFALIGLDRLIIFLTT